MPKQYLLIPLFVSEPNKSPNWEMLSCLSPFAQLVPKNLCSDLNCVVIVVMDGAVVALKPSRANLNLWNSCGTDAYSGIASSSAPASITQVRVVGYCSCSRVLLY